MLVCAESVSVLLFTNQMQAGFFNLSLVGDTNHNNDGLSTIRLYMDTYIYIYNI